MILSESQVDEILNKINLAVINPTTIHPFDEDRVRALFKNVLKNKVIYDISDLQTVVGGLNSEYSEYSKKTIFHIGEVLLRRFERAEARKLPN
jgi:pyruvate/2-oxoacid:ferredoxin oxidoreductase alpha subunit